MGGGQNEGAGSDLSPQLQDLLHAGQPSHDQCPHTKIWSHWGNNKAQISSKNQKLWAKLKTCLELKGGPSYRVWMGLDAPPNILKFIKFDVVKVLKIYVGPPPPLANAITVQTPLEKIWHPLVIIKLAYNFYVMLPITQNNLF